MASTGGRLQGDRLRNDSGRINPQQWRGNNSSETNLISLRLDVSMGLKIKATSVSRMTLP